MSWCRRKFPAQGVVAIFDEPNQDGDVLDFDAPRNAPAKYPEDHLDKIFFHSGLNLLEVAAEAMVTINHASVAAGGSISGNASQSVVFSWAGAVADNLLLDISDLGLSEAPLVLVSQGDNVIWPGMPVQTDTGGRARYVTAYSTDTEVRLWESASKTASTLAAVSIDYNVIVLRPPPGDLNDLLDAFDETTGEYVMGMGRFSSLRRYLQIAPGGSPVGVPLGRTIDLDDGAPRAVRADGTYFDPVPPGATVTISPGTGAAGSSIDYSGSYAGSDTLEVQAPGGSGSGLKGYVFDTVAKTMTFHGGAAAPTLVIPDSIPVILLPDEVAVTDHNAVLPDASKGRMYTHIWRYIRPPASFTGTEAGRAFVTALPQEWSDTTALLDAPDGTDVFVGQIRLSRTSAPSHNWLGSAINKLVPENVWITVLGGTSMLVEAHLGFARALSVYLDDDPESAPYRKLVLHQQQSIGPAPGGYGGFGTGYSAFSNPGNFDTGNSGETGHNGTAGWPVYYPGDTGAPHYRFRNVPIDEADPFSAALWVPPTTYRASGSTPPSITDPTNYSSTWQIDLRGHFGRRS